MKPTLVPMPDSMKRLICVVLGHRCGATTTVSGIPVRLCRRCGSAASAKSHVS